MRIQAGRIAKALGVLTVAWSMQNAWQPVRAQAAGDQSPVIWAGVFTAAQADRGKEAFNSFCVQCHGADLGGTPTGGPQLAGTRFRTSWDAASVNDLFVKISTTMPRNSPNLTPNLAADIISYILKSNGFPAGQQELAPSAESLARIEIIGKTGPMPAEPGQLVRTVGCLNSSGPDSWSLANADQPSRSRDPEPSDETQIKELATKAAGSHTLRLMAVDPESQAFKGQRVEVKGLLSKDGIAVMSVQAVARQCQ
jgi:mono/diheme cytochrome c family protein